MPLSRRHIIRQAPLLALPLLGTGAKASAAEPAPLFSISLAQWSLHRTFFGASLDAGFRERLLSDPDSLLQGEEDPLDFPVLARQRFGIDAVEYVNTFYYGKAGDTAYFDELKRRADGEGVRSLLIMCDALGNTGAADADERRRAVVNHLPWLETAAQLGCHAIRVNAAGEGPADALSERVSESLNALGDHAAAFDLAVLVENHGGLSSNGAWLAGTIERTAHPRVGTLPDFGNFRISGRGEDAVLYDRYKGVRELMPTARAVSAKSYDFDDAGNETTIDYGKMMSIVLAAGYRGYVGVEYEGRRLPEPEGIVATRDLLERFRYQSTTQAPSRQS
jgi:sugar phosphate isomerase/epimerase